MAVSNVPTRAETENPRTPEDRPGPTVAVRTEDGYRTDIKVRTHQLVCDEPDDKGGTDTGPTPRELMAAALAACTAITMRMYANRKEWPVHGIDVRAWHRQVDEKDPADPNARPRRVDVFDLSIAIEGELSIDQRERLLEIGGRCPVKRALDGHSRIVTLLE